MSQYYMNPSDVNDPTKLPNILIMFCQYGYCKECRSLRISEVGIKREACNDPECKLEDVSVEITDAGWFWWFCLPGCVPDSEPNGPFEREDLALADAREGFE
jgi:hypothetical protein